MPPKISAAESEVVPFAVAAPPLPPPPELSEQERGYWNSIVQPYPAERFQPDAAPTLTELCRAMGRSRKLAEQLDVMRRVRLIGASNKGAKVRQAFTQLARQAREEAKLVAQLSTKLRMCTQSWTRKDVAEPARERTPTGPRPWDVGPRDESAGQH
jgi:hypothetical protein